MKIVSVFNYPDEEKFNIMCCTWLKQVNINCNPSKILILSKNKPAKTIQDYVEFKKYKNIEFRVCKSYDKISFKGHPDCTKATHNVNFKLYNLCLIDEPYIFIDADAFIVSDYHDLIEASKDKPMIAINHQIIPGQTDHLTEPVLNSGVMIVSDPKFMNWHTFLKILMRDRGFRWPGTDQSLINSFCKESNYDYTHPNVGYGWNSWSKYSVLEGSKFFCRGLIEEHEVHVNHYWNECKPWNLDCPIYLATKREILGVD